MSNDEITTLQDRVDSLMSHRAYMIVNCADQTKLEGYLDNIDAIIEFYVKKQND